MKFRTRFLKLFFIINRKLKVARKESFSRSVSKEDDIITGRFSSHCSEFDVEPLQNIMKTSTPVKTNPLKMIVLQEVSHLKIYEEYDDIEPIRNNFENNDEFDISDLTVYENLRINNNNNFTLENNDYSLEYLEATGFKIYEDIGESFAVD